MKRREFVDRDEALAMLEIRQQTLYAYVSRGLVGTTGHPDDSRRRQYNVQDLLKLGDHKRSVRKPARIAEAALDWGLPVMETQISDISGRTLRYRGLDAVDLARTATLEQLALLLWDIQDGTGLFESQCSPIDDFVESNASTIPSILLRAQARILALPDAGMPMWQRSPSSLWQSAVTILRAVTSSACNRGADAEPIHKQLARAWALSDSEADYIRQALVLVADNELNPSAFAVRVIASTGAPLAASVLGGLAALSGPRHGGQISLVEAMFEDAGHHRDPDHLIEARLQRGDSLPGFGNILGSGPDARAAALLNVLPEERTVGSLRSSAFKLTGRSPNIDFALIALQTTLRLPPGSALAIFAVGRTVGWIAHALEQHRYGKLIRPRARYVEKNDDPS